MVIDALVNAFFGMVQWAIGLLPAGDPPGFISDTAGALGQLIAGCAGLSAWVPWAWCIGTVVVVLGVWLSLLTVKGIRWLVAWIPTMGGA